MELFCFEIFQLSGLYTREVGDIYEHLADEELVSMVQKGDTHPFGALVERFEPKLLRYGRKFLATPEDIEDAVQDVFISVYKNIQSFDLGQKFSPWIYRIAHNAFVNALKKHSRNPFQFMDFDVLVSHAVDDDPVRKEEEQKEMRQMIDAHLERLQPKYREVLILYYLEDMQYKEIGDILEVPTSTVGIRIKRAKDALKKIYIDEHPTYGK
ncbi:MAG: sigW [Parcubacteria group bacterium]|nr:sigW [Parcubacteria group bacterium]